MKTILIIISALTITASARIGESPELCSKRYGKPVHVDKENKILAYRKAGFALALKIWKGTTHQIYIESTTKDALDIPVAISDAQLGALLKANLGEGYGEKVQIDAFNVAYFSKDKKTVAKYNTMKHWLIISTVEFTEHEAAEKAKKEKAALEDF